ncbi:MAG: hypothetical protein WC532_07010 [Candidatus Omnitrophota bacterium]
MLQNKKWVGLACAIIISVFICPCALIAAEESDSGAQKEYRQRLESLISEEPEEEKEMPFEADTFVRYMPQRRVDAMAGKVGIIESGNECSYNLKAFGKLPMELSFETGYISINNSAEVKLPSHLTSLIAGIQTTLPFFGIDKTYFRLSLYPSFRSENWNARSSAFRMPIHTFMIYQPDKKWTFVAGVATFPDYRNKVCPILGFIYKPNDKLLFNIIPDNPSINYMLNDKITLFAEGGMLCDEFEVDKDGRKNVVLEYKSYRGGAGINYKFNKHIESSVSVGGVFGRRMQYRDSLGKVSVDSGMYSEFRVDITI